MHIDEESQGAELTRIVRGTPWLLTALDVVQRFGPPGAYIAAGSIRNTVWDALHGYSASGPTGDVDVVYFSASDDAVDRYECALHDRLPQYRWDVTNQATVHRWQSSKLGRDVPGYRSLADAISRWPETATAVAVALDSRGDLEIVAPFGLSDLLSMIVRPSPSILDEASYETRMQAKGWLERWPRLRVSPSRPTESRLSARIAALGSSVRRR